MQYIDAHAHIQMKEFDRDRDAVLSRMRDANMGAIVVGVDYESSKQAVTLAEQHDFLWTTVGLHPHDNLREVFDSAAYRALTEHPKVVGIGECGLDYSRVRRGDPAVQERQRDIFKQHIALALEVEKPLMLHCRPTNGTVDAYEDILGILDSKYIIHDSNKAGNVHFFVGDTGIARRFWERGFMTSFTGVITFASQYDAVIKNAPMENILAETDCPFVAPVPHRGERNEPLYVKEVVKRVAEIRGDTEENIVRATLENTRRVFGV